MLEGGELAEVRNDPDLELTRAKGATSFKKTTSFTGG